MAWFLERLFITLKWQVNYTNVTGKPYKRFRIIRLNVLCVIVKWYIIRFHEQYWCYISTMVHLHKILCSAPFESTPVKLVISDKYFIFSRFSRYTRRLVVLNRHSGINTLHGFAGGWKLCLFRIPAQVKTPNDDFRVIQRSADIGVSKLLGPANDLVPNSTWNDGVL